MDMLGRLTSYQRQVSMIRGSKNRVFKRGDLVTVVQREETGDGPSFVSGMLKTIGSVGVINKILPTLGWYEVAFNKGDFRYVYKPEWLHPLINTDNQFKEGDTVYCAINGSRLGKCTGVVGDYVLIEGRNTRKYTGLYK